MLRARFEVLEVAEGVAPKLLEWQKNPGIWLLRPFGLWFDHGVSAVSCWFHGAFLVDGRLRRVAVSFLILRLFFDDSLLFGAVWKGKVLVVMRCMRNQMSCCYSCSKVIEDPKLRELAKDQWLMTFFFSQRKSIFFPKAVCNMPSEKLLQSKVIFEPSFFHFVGRTIFSKCYVFERFSPEDNWQM